MPLKLAVNQVFQVSNSQFVNNQLGIHSGAINNFIITNNTFSVGTNANFATNTGVNVFTGTGFNIRDNTFTGIGNLVSTYPQSFGCIVRNTCASGPCSNNAVFRNTFTNLSYANQSEGRNRGTADTDPGLVYFCNNHSNDLVDIRVLRDPGLGVVYNQGIRANHFTGSGGSAVSPQNLFSQNAATGLPNPWYDIWLEQHSYLGNISYVRDAANANTNPWQSPAPPNVPNVVISAGIAKNCSVSDPFARTIGDLLTDNGFGVTSYETARQQYLDAKYLYATLIDGGNRPALEDAISYNWSDDAWQLRNELINRSPNLSSEIIRHTLNSSTLPPSLLLEVCLANIRSVKSPKMVEELEAHLPAYMMDVIRNYNEPSSYRKIVEEELVNAEGKLSLAVQSLVTVLSIDTLADRSDLVIALLEDAPLLSTKLQLVDAYIGKHDKLSATNALNNYISQANLNGYQDMASTGSFMNFIIQKSDDILNLDSNDIAYLLTVAADSSHPYFIRANNILRVNEVLEYNPQPLNLTPASYKTEQLVKSTADVSLSDVTAKLYPNPAKDYITLEYSYYGNATTLLVQIYDNSGKLILESSINTTINKKGVSNIEISQIPTGSYVLNLSNGTEDLSSSSFTKSQ